MAKRRARLTVTALVVSVLITAVVSSAQAEPPCAANLKGTYALEEKGTIAGVGPYATVGILTSDGRGSFEGTSTSSYGGFIVQETFSGNYTVNPDCTGAASFTGNVVHGTATRALVILHRGKDIQFIATDPGQVITGTLTKTTGE